MIHEKRRDRRPSQSSPKVLVQEVLKQEAAYELLTIV